MKKFLILFTILFVFASVSKAQATSSFGSGSNSGGQILTFFGISGMSCTETPQTNCDDNPEDGMFNAIACRVMKEVNTSVTPLYCNIVTNSAYLAAVNAAMILYVTIIGFSFLAGMSQVEFGVIAGQVIKAVVVYTFAVNSDVYFSIVYNTVLSLPEDIVRVMLSANGVSGGADSSNISSSGVAQNFFQLVDQGIYKIFSMVVKPAYNEATGTSYTKTNLKVVLVGLALWQIGGDLPGGMFMLSVIGWLTAYFSIMIRYLLAQITLMFLLMLGPLFIPMFLFKRFEDTALGWVKLMITFIAQMVLVVGFVLLIQNFFVEFYQLVKKGLDSTPMQQTTQNHLVQTGQNTQQIMSQPKYSDQSAEQASDQILGGDWKDKMPAFMVQLTIMFIIMFLSTQFLKLIPFLANLLTDNPAAPTIMGGDFGRNQIDLAHQGGGGGKGIGFKDVIMGR